MLTHINWLLKSRNRLPSGVQNQHPFAPATGIGSTLDCADHSNSVCALVRATISSPVMAGGVSREWDVIRDSKLRAFTTPARPADDRAANGKCSAAGGEDGAGRWALGARRWGGSRFRVQRSGFRFSRSDG